MKMMKTKPVCSCSVSPFHWRTIGSDPRSRRRLCHQGARQLGPTEECVIGTDTEQNADERADDTAGNRSGGEWHKYLEKAFNQDAAVHPQDAADDNAGDKQVQKVRVFGEHGHRVRNRSRQQMVVS